ncbi:hypothetical protein JTE90_012263 [Oedothorax gibbosus]|uniref:Uncharacterized protein n=1 Tax=Oedothorax gibbosus TaxID=931172 RepID=A0AAV6VJX4_9ARAC|nr:hypothetical protein JTE90_012263 [Oedothorax gibbosus]
MPWRQVLSVSANGLIKYRTNDGVNMVRTVQLEFAIITSSTEKATALGYQKTGGKFKPYLPTLAQRLTVGF